MDEIACPAMVSVGFNEAEAIKPRNQTRTRCDERLRWPCRFNEAEAIKPRNLVNGCPPYFTIRR